jgi:peptidoglycan/LPS O-acetylase OafA/YrhL
MKLAAALQRDNNNLDLFRLIAACMVIYGHAFALAPGGSTQDFVGSTLGFDYSGSLAVKIFFFLSGLVVTNSLIEKGDPLRFVIARVFRIWPAFLVVVTASALILGPLMSNLPPSDYFGHPDTFRYIRRNALMNIQFMLPGVFEDNPYKGAVNGSLWSIPLEVGAYIVLLGLFMLGVLKSRLLALGIFLLIALDPLVGNRLLFTWLGEPELKLLPPCFAFGAILALYKDHIRVDARAILGAWLLYYLFRHSAHNFYFFYAALFLSIVHLATTTTALRLRPKADISYGVYLWGFPVQQVMAHHFAAHGVVANQLLSLGVTLLLGLASWHLVEKRCIALGGTLTRRWAN